MANIANLEIMVIKIQRQFREHIRKYRLQLYNSFRKLKKTLKLRAIVRIQAFFRGHLQRKKTARDFYSEIYSQLSFFKDLRDKNMKEEVIYENKTINLDQILLTVMEGEDKA